METIKNNFFGLVLIVLDLGIIFFNVYQLIQLIHLI